MSTDLLLLGHAPWAQAMREVALHAFPDATGLLALDAEPQCDIESLQQRLREAIETTQSHGCLVLVDVAGASPANALQGLLAAYPSVRAVAGCNVAMLWRTLGYRHLDAASLQARALEGALAAVVPLEPR